MTQVVKNQDDRRFWYELCLEDGEPLTPSSDAWQSTIKAIREHRDGFKLHSLPEWQNAVNNAVNAGIVCDRNRYLTLLRDVSIGLAIHDLEDRCDKDEMALIHLVRILDETDQSISRLSEKIEDYYIALHPARLPDFERNIRSLVDTIARDGDHPLSHLAKNIQRLHDSRTIISKNVREHAEKILPNMSALCGPLVSARLLAKAGSRYHLAKMPAASLQVLGAGPSLFTHLTSGTNPPKHGIIYQYKGVRHAKRRFRGRVSRVIACQLVIAARIDNFRKVPDEEFIIKAGRKISMAGKEV